MKVNYSLHSNIALPSKHNLISNIGKIVHYNHPTVYPMYKYSLQIAGVKSDELTIKTDLFKHYSLVETFQVRLYVTDNTTGVTSKTHQTLVRNHGPYGGNCTIYPNNGTAGLTNFSIECDGFIDDQNEIDEYRIFCELFCLFF